MRLLIATGGSSHSALAVRAGLDLARRLDAEVILLFVVGKSNQSMRAATSMDSLTTQWADSDTEVIQRVRVGRVLPILYEEIKKNAPDLLVLGERLPHRLLTRFRGTIVSRIASSAPCPVLIAKSAKIDLSRVLICDSGALPPTVFDGLALHGMTPLLREAEITVLHVMSQISAAPGIHGGQLRAGAEELIRIQAPEGKLLARDLMRLEEQHLTAQVKVRHGLVVDEILAEATEGNNGLIIIGGHRTGGWPALLLDDLAHQIVTRLDRSLLVVR